MIARYSSLCPWCGIYINKNQSRTKPLDCPMSVQPDRWAPRIQNGWGVKSGHYDPAEDYKLRKWVHERCYADAVNWQRERDGALARARS